jgi:Abnormal spindle-like microcephaly-assoc'd, ASPM-SPD-2-Hydin
MCTIGVMLAMCSSFAWSWGEATHIFINKEAGKHLPSPFPFFANNIQWISDHAPDADYRRNTDPTEAPKHFIDIEDYPEFAAGTLSHNYDSLVLIHGLSTVTKIGVVPWSIIWSLDSLTNCLRRGDSARALQFAADLGHYVGDAHQPLHVTANYDGPNKTSDGVHSRYESTMLNPSPSYNYLSQVAVVAKSVHFIPVPVDTNFAFILHGNGLADSIFDGDAYATSIDPQHGSDYYAALWEETGAMTQNQIQDATVDLANLWFTAAINAGIVPNTFTLSPPVASPKTLACGEVTPGGYKNIPFTLVNNEADSLNVSIIISSGNSFSVQTTSANLMPGQSLADTLRFSPAAPGTASGWIVITSNGASSPDTIFVNGIGAGNAELHLLTHSISFGNVKVGQSKDTTLTITNNGGDTLKITGVTSDSIVFSAKPSVYNLNPGQSFTDTLTFSPSAIGPVQTSILIVSNSGTSPDTITVDGTGESTTGIAAPQSGMPDQFGLSQNFPNPFNPSTMIRYALPYRSIVHIKIFNVLGQLISELVNGEEAAGYREVVWNAAVPSGMYFYRIEAISIDHPTLKFTAVRKMLLLK